MPKRSVSFCQNDLGHIDLDQLRILVRRGSWTSTFRELKTPLRCLGRIHLRSESNSLRRLGRCNLTREEIESRQLLKACVALLKCFAADRCNGSQQCDGGASFRFSGS
jgi:hypothetical protein